jgi:hypothetical protein
MCRAEAVSSTSLWAGRRRPSRTPNVDVVGLGAWSSSYSGYVEDFIEAGGERLVAGEIRRGVAREVSTIVVGVDLIGATAREFVLGNQPLVTVSQIEPTIRFERESGAVEVSGLQLARTLS